MDRPAGIVGIGSAVPEGTLTNQDLERMVDTSDEWIVERTGIRTRHITDSATTTSMLATEAGRRAMAAAGVGPEDLDLIIVATATPDMLFPSTGCLVQRNLGASRAAAFDIAAACTGFIYGLNLASGMIALGVHETVLVIGAETLTKITDYTDRGTCVLFGDGAGAAVVRPVEKGRGFLSLRIHSDGNLADELKLPGGGSLHPATEETVAKRLHYLRMNGNSVFKAAVTCMAGAAREAMDAAGVTTDDLALFIPHQANIRIIEATGRKLRVPKEKLLVNVDRFGNTSAASIPIALDEAIQDGRVAEGDLVGVVAFGAGFTWGSAVIRL
ncbi:MAG: beta-ketoacyl-ACP synthase III [Gemmatimonadota bacterium]|nr:3-oxoacyl-ACP synthase [Gemmatimonadota bacterium]MDP6529318.1 beta-ketoacyl-ACP synthase III [Gemmatimonadota bacterium]MDP6802203.1 beta-ketoacyl-ACP synthase III [Gemmatimonadota bacterium]MDP7031533.1 beta-ketoacyl-ACP synthase III [Gemmatimonadota bacterium]